MNDSDRRIARRYRLERVIGRGAHGEVWQAHDALAARTVAVKIIGHAFAAARVRREVAALRLLKLPGVVGLVDEGVDDGDPFLVMDLVPGAPFPGIPVPAPWASIEEATLGLLDVLSRIHAAGVVHRDLKPPNVLVDQDHRVTLLDFGLCNGSLDDDADERGAMLGSPAYSAPEQIRGEPVNAATDLYALGMLLHHALVGRLPQEGDDPAAMTRARLTTKARSLRESGVEGIPDAVVELVDMLLEVDEAKRPRSAAEVSARLRGTIETARHDPIAQAVDDALEREPGNLQGLFAGPDRLLHLREDAARLLHERAGDDRSRLVTEITGWVRSGLARWDGERLHVDRAALERIEAIAWIKMPSGNSLRPAGEGNTSRAQQRAAHRALASAMPTGTPGRLLHLLAAGRAHSTGAAIAAEALHVGQSLASQGRLDAAAFVLGEAARSLQDDDAVLLVLARWAEVALVEATPRSIDRVLYEVCRTHSPSPLRASLEALLRAALAVGTWTERALSMVEAIAPFVDPALERRRHGVRVLAARRSSLATEESVLRDVERFVEVSGDALARASLAGWLGRLRYRQGRFEEAAVLHDEAARTEEWTTARIAARINAASSLMEAFQLEEASRQAEDARLLAAACRDAFYEGRAEWLLRAIAFRRDMAVSADLELVEAASRVGVRELEAVISLNEAAVSFRLQQLGQAAMLATRALRLWSDIGDPTGALLAAALRVACGETVADVALLQERARESPVPGIGIQVLALIATGKHAITCARDELRALSDAVPRPRWHARMEVLSVDESLRLLDLTTPSV